MLPYQPLQFADRVLHSLREGSSHNTEVLVSPFRGKTNASSRRIQLSWSSARDAIVRPLYWIIKFSSTTIECNSRHLFSIMYSGGVEHHALSCPHDCKAFLVLSSWLHISLVLSSWLHIMPCLILMVTHHSLSHSHGYTSRLVLSSW